MKIKVWIKSYDLGDGSHSFTCHPTEERARQGIDDDDLDEDGTPCEVDCDIIDISEYEVVT